MKRWFFACAMVLLGAALPALVTGLQGQVPRPAVAPEHVHHASYRDIVKRVLPAVVSIETRTKVAAAERTPRDRRVPQLDPNMPEEFKRFFEDFRKQPFDLEDSPRQGFGSGFIIDPTGVIVTNAHVVDGAETATVQLHDGRKFTARTIRVDKRTDLAVVLLEAGEKNLPVLELGDSDVMEIGDHVLAVGAPFGLAGSVTHGIVSAKGRNGLKMNMYEDFIQTDAAINPGNSGGPLVNMDGRVVGINAAIKTRSGGFQGVGLAVASNLARNVIQALRTDGVVKRGYLGVQVRDLDPEVAGRLGLDKEQGIVLGEVFENTPAAKAGLKAGDLVASIDGQGVKDSKRLQQIVAGLPINKAVQVEVVRDGKRLTVPVTIEEQPDEFGSARAPVPQSRGKRGDELALDKIGVEVAELTEQRANDFGYRAGTSGVVITRVVPSSVAEVAGLQKGMLILKVDNERVASVDQLSPALERASLSRGIVLQVQSPQGGTTYVLIRSNAKG